MIDAHDRVTGQISYAINLGMPGMVFGAILRSPHPHATLRRIDARRAEQLPGVIAVLTRDDVLRDDRLSPYFGPVVKDAPVVAIDRVRYVGEPVAAVAGADEETTREALALIDVEYEELPAVFDAEEALQPGAPQLHERGNNLLHVPVRRGDVEQGLTESDFVFEDVFTSPPVQHVPLEPHACIAHVANGRVTVWSGTQTPYVTRSQLADIFRVPLSRVRVVVPTLGGGYGAKCYPRIEPITAALAWKAARPVKVVLHRAEVFQTLTKHGATVRMLTGVKRDGTLVARRAACYLNTGAYADVGPQVARSCSMLTGPYRIPHVQSDVYAAYTNLVPAGAFRGYGAPQIAWAYESQMDIIAERLGIDPLELRLKNVLRAGDAIGDGGIAPELHGEDLLLDAARAIGWGERDGSAAPGIRRGKGLSLVIKGMMTPSASSATMKLNGDGSLEVLTSSVEMGQGVRTVLGQIAADGAGVPYELVSVSCPDTESTPFDQTTSSSRTTFVMGNAVQRAGEDVRRQVIELAAQQLEVSPQDLDARDGRVTVRGAPERGLTYAEVVQRSRRGNVVGTATFVGEAKPHPQTGQPHGPAQWHLSAAACEVEVDVETGRFSVPRYYSNTHAGRVVNPRQCELQIEGSALFGLGQVLFEEMVYDQGRLVNPNLSDYMLMSLKDAPRELRTRATEDAADGEIHGIGEQCLPPAAPAVANALAVAAGVRVRDLPITPERVVQALSGTDIGERQVAADTMARQPARR
jgi:CO/xanthine dehydrogenase Mo-binding subunit